MILPFSVSKFGLEISVDDADSRGNRFGTSDNPHPSILDAKDGMRSHSTDVTHADGSVTRVINIGAS